MKKLGFIALFLCCCMAINLSMATAADVEAASDAELPAAVAEAQPDADAEITADDEELDAELPETDAELSEAVEDLDAALMAANDENVTYPIKDADGEKIGVYYFDATKGVIQDCVSEEGKEIKSLQIPASIYGVLVTRIASNAFKGCTLLESVTIPESITEIGNSTFQGLAQLKEVQFSNNVTKIGTSAFSNCTALASVDLPTRLTAIPNHAFQNCTSLTSITISTNVASIGADAFAGCNALTEMRYEGSLQQWLGITVGAGNRCLLDVMDDDSFAVESPTTPPAIINSVSVSDMSGKVLKTIPSGQFLASVSVTSLKPLDDAVVFFAAYSVDGKYQGLNYAFVQTTVGATTKVTFPMENPNGAISQIRAFAVKSLGDLTPLSNPVTFSS